MPALKTLLSALIISALAVAAVPMKPEYSGYSRYGDGPEYSGYSTYGATDGDDGLVARAAAAARPDYS